MVTLDPIYDPKNEEFIYKYRRETNEPLVAAYGSELLVPEKAPKGEKKDKKDKKVKKDPYNHLVVITERIPHRLADAPQLTEAESLYVLDRSLQGFETAYEKCGPMGVNDRMIGFNNEGHCKVWVNEDFSSNHPGYPKRVLQSTLEDSKDYLEGRFKHWPASSDEADMVQDVVNAVEEHCEEGRFNGEFGNRIRQPNLSFSEARRIVHEASLNSRWPVPDRVDLFSHLIRGYRRRTDWTVPKPPIYHPEPPVYHRPEPTHGYRFNYLPPERPYQPDIFASRVGEHGVHNGNRY